VEWMAAGGTREARLQELIDRARIGYNPGRRRDGKARRSARAEQELATRSNALASVKIPSKTSSGAAMQRANWESEARALTTKVEARAMKQRGPIKDRCRSAIGR